MPTSAAKSRPSGIQAGVYLLELSLDWIVLRASENVHQLLGKSHVTLIDEPLGRFVHCAGAPRSSQPLLAPERNDRHRPRLCRPPDRRSRSGRHRLPAERRPGAARSGAVDRRLRRMLRNVGGLIAGLADSHGQALLDGGARRMRALTGYDRVTLSCGDERAESSRGAFAAPARRRDDLPPIVADTRGEAGRAVPAQASTTSSIGDALMRSPPTDNAREARDCGRPRQRCACPSSLTGSTANSAATAGRRAQPSFELHAAAELFAQLFAMRLEIDRLKPADQPPK